MSVGLNYHELTLNEPRDSPQRRQQFLVICSVMAAAFVYSALTSGAFQPVRSAVDTKGVFPGGNLCYKYATRDYAASMGLGRFISEDYADQVLKTKQPYRAADDADDGSTDEPVVTLPGDEDKAKDEKKELQKKMQSKLYHFYLDDPFVVTGMHQRWMTGALVSDAEKAEYCDPIMSLNPSIERLAKKNKNVPFGEKKAREAFGETLYELVDLPSVDSLVLQFPFTNGFLSSLIFSYKLQPVLRAMAIEQGEKVPVIISHCSKEQEMCTHFVPLVQGTDFLMGRPTAEEHVEAIGVQPMLVSWSQVKGGARKLSPPWLQTYIDMLP